MNKGAYRLEETFELKDIPTPPSVTQDLFSKQTQAAAFDKISMAAKH